MAADELAIVGDRGSGTMVRVSEELIEELATEIVREIDPERIVLFGSWARGQAHDTSDVDLLVIEREQFGPDRSRRKEAARIWRCLSRFRVPTDILVYSSDEEIGRASCRERVSSPV
jgi:predicted nucleotidyltransferase